MRKILLSLLIAFTIFGASAQNSNRKVVIDVTSTDFKVYQSVLLTVKIIAENQPNTQIDVIAYGEAVPMLMKNRSAVAAEIVKYVEFKNVSFTACEISMSLFNIKKEQLLHGVQTVHNAVDTILDKQKGGWGYLKAGN